jgi:hypothetical protein
VFFHFGYLKTFSLSRLYSVVDRMINECGGVSGMRRGRGKQNARRAPTIVPFCQPQTRHDLTLDRTCDAGVEDS